ncbi:MAG: hypothetical protein P1V20_25885 [Verrucomicrobiales bacterium]|nr:hypothetical protein [Verrucomicrobiales bacterium]
MLDVWQNLTGAQAHLLSTVIVVTAGAFSILIFRGKVRDLKSALEESRKVIDQYNCEVKEKLEALDEQFAITMEGLGSLRSEVGNLQDFQHGGDTSNEELREELKKHWYPIYHHLEEIAADPNLHWKTRAKYSRISRYTSRPLVEAMIQDKHLVNRANEYKEAADLWAKHRNGRAELRPEDVQQMRDYALKLVPKYQPDS